MPRKARTISSSGIYHIVIRGADHQLYFEEANDYLKYLELLERYKTELGFSIYAFCLMTNHVHLLININNCSLEKIFRRLNTNYSLWFNSKYNRVGFFQQGRYYSEPIENQLSLLNVARYIHQNPTKAGLENHPGDSYPWSSIYNYISGNSHFLDLDYLPCISGTKEIFMQYQLIVSNDHYLDTDNIRKRLPDDVARKIILEETSCSTVTDFQSLNITMRNQSIIRLSSRGLSVRQLNRLTGTPKGVIERVLRKKELYCPK